jgi:hypothetical protein
MVENAERQTSNTEHRSQMAAAFAKASAQQEGVPRKAKLKVEGLK